MNDIKYLSWTRRKQWVQGIDYQKHCPTRGRGEVVRMPDAFQQFLENRFDRIGKNVHDYFTYDAGQKKSNLQLETGEKCPRFQTWVFDYVPRQERWQHSLADGYDQGDADWRVAWHGTRMECIFAIATRERLEPGPQFNQGQRAVLG